jgi:hypothetical protein
MPLLPNRLFVGCCYPTEQRGRLIVCVFNLQVYFQRDMRSELDSEIYEEIDDDFRKPELSRPTVMELIQPRKGQHGILWCEIPEVHSSGILSKKTCN